MRRLLGVALTLGACATPPTQAAVERAYAQRLAVAEEPIRKCYEQALFVRPDLEVRLALSLRFDAGATTPRTIDVESSEVRERELSACVRRALQAVRWDGPVETARAVTRTVLLTPEPR